jgi:cytoskeleton protein RodZ
MRLRRARNERGLSVDDVARQLRLSPRVISALEDGAYERLPSATYVRGYLRSYAALLGLEPQQLIDEFNNLPHAAQPADMTAPAQVREVKSSDAMIRFGTVLVAVVVLGLAALWWSGKDGTVRRRVAAAPVPAVAPPPEAPRPEATPNEPVDTAPIPAPAKSTEPAVAAPVQRPAVAAPSLAQVEPAMPAPDENAPRLRLVLRVQEDSWADVRDAQQRRLLYETVAAGRVVNVEGVAPLSVFLGNVEGVTVELNGRPYDVARYKRGQVARFTLGAPSNVGAPSN